jgi:hypothetical protein
VKNEALKSEDATSKKKAALLKGLSPQTAISIGQNWTEQHVGDKELTVGCHVRIDLPTAKKH